MIICDNNCNTCVLTGSSGSENSGSLKLVAGNSSSGVLQLYQDGEWGTICGRSFGHLSAHVACRELGYQTSTGYSAEPYVQ